MRDGGRGGKGEGGEGGGGIGREAGERGSDSGGREEGEVMNTHIEQI